MNRVLNLRKLKINTRTNPNIYSWDVIIERKWKERSELPTENATYVENLERGDTERGK